MPEITTLGSAAPGTVVPSGSLITPSGDQGPTGTQGSQGPAGSTGSQGPQGSQGPAGASGTPAWTLVGGSGFTVPAYGGSVTVTVADTTWMALGEWVYVDDANGTGSSGQLVITAKTPTSVTLFNPTPATYPLATTAQAGLLTQISGNTTDFIDGTNTCQPIAPQITSVRLRSFNAVGNPTFEVDQRTVFSGTSTNGSFAQDRWTYVKAGSTLAASCAAVGTGAAGAISIPGTNFGITTRLLRFTLTAQQASLAAGDQLVVYQSVEGPLMRELVNDVHSVSLLVQSSVANLKFGVAFRDSTATRSLVKLCALGAANTWTMISLPNIPVFVSGGGWSVQPGAVGYQLFITLAGGSTLTPPANDTWQNGNFYAAVGQSNFAASPVNSTFDIAFVQHEPGPVCTTLIDKPFTQNLDECLRYFQKSYSQGVKPGAVDSTGAMIWFQPNAVLSVAYQPYPFKKTMAKIPTMNSYSPVTGVAAAVRDLSATTDVGVTGLVNIGDAGFSGFQLNTTRVALTQLTAHYVADTGW